VERLRRWIRERPMPVAMLVGGATMLIIAIVWIVAANPYR
jgi:hypothetical protein